MMVRYKQKSPDDLKQIYSLSFFYLGALALPMAGGLFILAHTIIPTIYQAKFMGAVLPLQILAWSLIFYYLTIPNVRLLLVNERQNLITGLQVISLSANVVLNLLLDKVWGATGASIARVCSTFLFFALCHFVVSRQYIHLNPIKNLSIPMMATLVMGIAIWVFKDGVIWLVIPVGIILYFGTLLLVRGMSEAERLWVSTQYRKLFARGLNRNR
jgi:O-antigen/teichoic acid export membrane protein